MNTYRVKYETLEFTIITVVNAYTFGEAESLVWCPDITILEIILVKPIPK